MAMIEPVSRFRLERLDRDLAHRIFGADLGGLAS